MALMGKIKKIKMAGLYDWAQFNADPRSGELLAVVSSVPL